MNTLKHLLSDDIVQVLLMVILGVVAAFTSGCASLYDQAATRLEITTPEGLTVSYHSPKDQHIEYDPDTGKVVVKSQTNAELAAQAAKANAEERRAQTDLIKTVIERIPLNPKPPIADN